MRYTTIHHDVREEFGLTLSEYIVCDSIHQLSHQYPTTKSNRVIADFVGLHHSTVAEAKTRLIELGLVVQLGDGHKTTQLWWEAVTLAKNSQPSEKTTKVSENPKSLYIYNKDNNSESKDSPILVVKEKEEDKAEVKKTADPDWPLFISARQVLSNDAGFEIRTGAWDFKNIKKAREFLGSPQMVLDLIGDMIDNGTAHKLGYSLSRILSASNLNRHKAENS